MTMRIEKSYTGSRFIYDADAHLVESPYFLKDHAEPALRDRMPLCWTSESAADNVANAGVVADKTSTEKTWQEVKSVHQSKEFKSKRLENVLLDKQLGALGSFDSADRAAAMDQMGFQRQVVFNTFANEVLQKLETSGDLELIRGAARAHNRGVVEFCAADQRLFPSGYVPLSDLECAHEIAAEAIKMGCKTLLVAQVPPKNHSPTHEKLERVWSTAAEAGVPIAMHVGGGGDVLPEPFNITGRPATPQFNGGEGPMHSLRVLQLANPAKAFVAAMVYDGVFMRHPALRVGVYELGCMWLPSFIRELDAVASGFKMEPRLQQLDQRPSEYVLQQVKVTPYPYEDVRWVMEQSSDEMVMFVSDFPHHEGGRDPLKRFDSWLDGAPKAMISRFYVQNFADFYGGNLAVANTIAA